MKILVDFDGTCVPALPEAGYSEVDTGAERVLKLLVSSGHELYLWTVRNNSRNNPYNYINGKFRNESSLEEAVRWFKERDIPLSGVNEVPGEEDIVGYSRKALGDMIIDDISVGIPLIYGEVSYFSYQTEEMRVANSRCVDWKKLEELFNKEGIICL